MTASKNMLSTNVHDAAKERISWTFDNFEKIYVSFSGGKDSTVLLHLVMEEAITRGRIVGVLFLDWECQFRLTIDHIREMYLLYEKHIDPYWVALPIMTTNGCSQFEPEWISWDVVKRDLWIREKDSMSIQDEGYFPFYAHNMTFEEFMPAFGKWYSRGERCACFVGIRTGESLNRWRAIFREDRRNYDNKKYTSNIIADVWNVYPIYDWDVKDDWTYYGKTGKPYNRLYDRLYQAGLTLSQMRVDEPFGEEQRRGLWLYQIIEPQTWAKMCARVAGANSGALYCKTRGNIMGNAALRLPDGHTWESFAMFLLKTMPPNTAEHYKNKIAAYLNWFKTRGYPNNIPDDGDIKNQDPSWHLICKTLLRNDYWCMGLNFSPTKTAAYGKYCELMKKRREKWGIFNERQVV